jgi:adenylate kinase
VVAEEGQLFVSLLGPPGAGKTTVSAALAAERKVSIFRLRESAWLCRHLVPGLADALRETRDPLGWIDDELISPLLREEIPRLMSVFPSPEVVILENFPGNERQVESLVEYLSTVGPSQTRYRVVELEVPPPLLRARVEERRVCSACDPDPRGDPHAPALDSQSVPGRCARCGGELQRRPSDEPDRFELRLCRYRSNRPGLLAACAAHGVTVSKVSAATPGRHVIGNVLLALS